jgi:hypothetical protein
LQPCSHTEHSLWLLPAEPLKSRLRCIISELAKTYGAVDFEPHVTISCGLSNDDETQIIARHIASQFSIVDLIVLKLDCTNNYTKSLFIQFQESDAVRRMSDAVKILSVRPTIYVLSPHLSLLYKMNPPATQAYIRRTLVVPKGAYSFDRLRGIETEIPLTQPEQIKRWRTVFECGLGPSK